MSGFLGCRQPSADALQLQTPEGVGVEIVGGVAACSQVSRLGGISSDESKALRAMRHRGMLQKERKRIKQRQCRVDVIPAQETGVLQSGGQYFPG